MRSSLSPRIRSGQARAPLWPRSALSGYVTSGFGGQLFNVRVMEAGCNVRKIAVKLRTESCGENSGSWQGTRGRPEEAFVRAVIGLWVAWGVRCQAIKPNVIVVFRSTESLS